MSYLDRAGCAPGSSSVDCCCGNADCHLLKKNSSILEALEKDVHTAAQLGQALLARHEAYMADAERDRLRLNARIERLQLDKQELETENATKEEENSLLLERLENLNTTVSDSDSKITSLEASLLSSQQAIRRLEAAAARATDAEHQLQVLESEQERLYEELRDSKDDARSHAQRFKEAQRGILDMQSQVERMEKEAREERERHAETMKRMEKQRDAEKHLDAAALRLKGAAASKSITHHNQGNKIVGNFVRDLLQDNANLQLGIAELREMLMSSNDEIQSLREQLMFHQPLPEASPASTLKAELAPLQQEPPITTQEFHIHHHYHLSAKQDGRRSKRKRHSLLPFTPPAVSSRSSSPGPWSNRRIVSSPTAPALLSYAGNESTANASSNWQGFSTASSEFSSSLPSSPQSNPHGFFDHVGNDTEFLSSPTTSYDPMSPTWRASHRKRISEASSSSFQSLSIIDHEPSLPAVSPHRLSSIIIHEEEEDAQSADMAQVTDIPELEPPIPPPEAEYPDHIVRVSVPRLRRAASHESIISLAGGLDIHTLKARPSQLALRPLGGADAIVTGVVAQPTMSMTYAKRSDAALRDHFTGLGTSKRSPSPATASITSNSSSQTSRSNPGRIGKWVGWRPWGGGTNAPLHASNDGSKPMDREPNNDLKRASGINQPGTVPGFQQYWMTQKRKGAPAQVTTENVDRDALSESLRDTGLLHT